MSKKDKIIIMVLLGTVVLGSIWWFGVNGLGESVAALEATVRVVEDVNERHAENLARQNQINLSIPRYEEAIESILSQYTGALYQEEYILYLRQFLMDNGVLLNSFTHNQTSALTNAQIESLSNKYYELYMQFNTTQTDEEEHITAYKRMMSTQYGLSFNSIDYDNLMLFLRDIEESGSGFRISSINISRGAGELLNVNLTLIFYYIANSDELGIEVDFTDIIGDFEGSTRGNIFQ